MTQQRDLFLALRNDLARLWVGIIPPEKLETVLRARVLPLVQAAQQAELVLRRNNVGHEARQAISSALHAMTDAEVKPCTQAKRRRHSYAPGWPTAWVCPYCGATKEEDSRSRWTLNGKPAPWCEGQKLVQDSR